MKHQWSMQWAFAWRLVRSIGMFGFSSPDAWSAACSHWERCSVDNEEQSWHSMIRHVELSSIKAGYATCHQDDLFFLIWCGLLRNVRSCQAWKYLLRALKPGRYAVPCPVYNATLCFSDGNGDFGCIHSRQRAHRTTLVRFHSLVRDRSLLPGSEIKPKKVSEGIRLNLDSDI